MYRSAFIFALFVFAASAMTRRAADDEAPSQPDPKVQRCTNETGFDPHADSNDESKMACYMACVWKIENMMHEDGTLNTAAFLGDLPAEYPGRDMIVQVVNDCTKNKGANDCETVSNAIACFKRSEDMLDAKMKKTFLRE